MGWPGGNPPACGGHLAEAPWGDVRRATGVRGGPVTAFGPRGTLAPAGGRDDGAKVPTVGIWDQMRNGFGRDRHPARASGRGRGAIRGAARRGGSTEWRGWGLLLRGIRVYELARELDISSKEILRLLADEMNIEMNNHMATLNDQVVAKLRRLVAEQKGSRSAPAAPAARRSAQLAPAAEQAPAAPPPRREPARPVLESRPAGLRPAIPSVRQPQAARSGAHPGAVHFRPAPGLLPLVTPRPAPPRPRRATRVEPAAPVMEAERSAPPHPAEAPLMPAVATVPAPQTPVTPAVSSQQAPSPPVAAPVAPAEPAAPAAPAAEEVPAAGAELAAEDQVGPGMAAAASALPEPPVAPPAPSIPIPAPEAISGPMRPAASSAAPGPSALRSAATRPAALVVRPAVRPVVGDAVFQTQGPLLPVRKVVPGAVAPRRDPDRPLLPVRKAEPRPAGGGPVLAPAAPGAPGERTGTRGRRESFRTAEGTLDVRRRGGAGRRPARPGGVAVGEGEVSTGGRRAHGRRRGRRLHLAADAAQQLMPPETITLTGPVLVADLAGMLRVSAPEIIRKLLGMGVMAAINQQLEAEHARAIAGEFGVTVEADADSAAASPVDRRTVGVLLAGDDPTRRAERPPIVAVLGHVDHGKTTLLDAIRSARVAEGEAGGITQHIGAYVVHKGERRVVFLDTPGHEAFTAMRARGAQVTDIAVLVVAADDGVMPQTLEALSHARAAGVPVVVALNKIDKPNANRDRVLQQLADHGLVPEEWGGETIVCPVSALRREGIDQLLEMLLLVADLQALRADPERAAVGTIIEAEVARGRGPVATVLVQSGTLRVGDTFVAGQVYGRVRAMTDDIGRPVREAGPSTPVEVLGFDDVPGAGDAFQVMSEREARETAGSRQDEGRREALAADRAVNLADFRQEGQDGPAPDLRVILKADVQGSLEAVRGSLEKLHNEEARVVLLHGGVGPVNESDVMLAAASGAVILGFNVRPDAGAEREAQRVGVPIQTHRIIYQMLDEVQKALDGRLKPKMETVTVGHAEIRKPIRVPDVGVIAGSFVTDGLVRRGALCRLLRGGTIVYEGTVASLRRFKDDAREVAAGYECGIGLERFADVKEGDVIEVLEQREIPR